MNSIKTRFSNRLSLYICAVVAPLFILAASVAITKSVREATSHANESAFSHLDNISWEIEAILNSSKTAVETMAPSVILELSKENPSEEKLHELTRQLVSTNKMIIGSIIALPPYSLGKDRNLFAAYSLQDTLGNISSYQVGNDNYDYTTMDWYLIPKLVKDPYWTDPYFDSGAGNLIMCTYSKPLIAPDGRFLGVLTADLPCDWLNEKVNSIKPYRSSYNILIGKDGSYIVHPDPKRILKETIFSATSDMSDTTVRFLGREMISGKRGYVQLENDDTTSLVYYTPIPSNGWSLSMICPIRDIQAGTYRLTTSLVIVLSAAMILIFIITNLVVRRVSRPLHAFSDSAKIIAGGDFNAELPEIRSHDEMMLLKNSFEYMQTSLKQYIGKLTETTALKERIESELKIAREIQMSMIPKIFPPFPNRKDLDIAAYLKPAKEVGGDLYDFFIESEKLYFAVGDVSGKGIPASLFMAVSRSIFRSISGILKDPASIISTMNDEMCDGNNANMFVTLFVGILDLKTGMVQYCNAGHNPPVLLKADGEAILTDVSGATGIPVGIFPQHPYSNGHFRIRPGDRLVLYTDGVTEAENKDSLQYGESRLLGTIRDNARNCPAVKDMLEAIINDLGTHVAGAPQSDDITVMIIKSTMDSNTASPEFSKIELRNEIRQLTLLTDWVSSICERSGIDPVQTMHINLALEEAATNVIRYAYPKDGVSHTFSVDFDREGDMTVWRIIDSGTPFDPTAKEDADISLGIEERPVGGLGIFLVKQLTDQVSYCRENGYNILTISVRISK